jgi:hypothetical protein
MIAGLQRVNSGPKPTGKPRGKPWPKGTSGNPSGRRRGSASIVAALKRLTTRADAEAVARKLLALAKGGDLQAMRLLLDRLDGPQNGPLAITMAQAMNVTTQQNPNETKEFLDYMSRIPTSSLIANMERPAKESREPPPPPLIGIGRGDGDGNGSGNG